MTNNELIAEFMGVKPLHMGGSVEYEIYGILDFIEDGIDEQHFFLEEELKFHSSWDWLMPVISKCRIESNSEDHYWEGIYYTLEECNIDITYPTVVNFIKRTNLNQQI